MTSRHHWVFWSSVLIGVFSLLGTLVLGGLARGYWANLQTVPLEAEPVTIAQALTLIDEAPDGRIWATLRDGTWDCRTLETGDGDNQRHTSLLYTDGAASAWVMVYLKDDLPCFLILRTVPSGMLSRMSAAERANVHDRVIGVDGEGRVGLRMCCCCGHSDTLALLILMMSGLAFSLAGVLLPLQVLRHPERYG